MIACLASLLQLEDTNFALTAPPMSLLLSDSSSTVSIESWSSDTLPILSLSTGDFVIKGILGKGTYGMVYKASKCGTQDAEHVAIKAPRRPKCDLRHEGKVANILSQLSVYIMPCTPGVMPDGTTCLVMPVAQGSVERMAGNCSTTWLKWLIHDVGDALVAAHERGIAHGDIKPEQIFAMEGTGNDRPRFALGDFGFSSLKRTVEVRGSPAFMDEASHGAYKRWYQDREYWSVFVLSLILQIQNGIAIDIMRYDLHAFALSILVLVVGDHIVDFRSDESMKLWHHALRYDLDWTLGRFQLTREARCALAIGLDPTRPSSVRELVDAATRVDRWTE